MSFTTKKEGWVIVNEDHPKVTVTPFIVDWTFSRTRTAAIKLFLQDMKPDWRWWKRKFKYKVVRAEMTITVKDGP